MLVQAVLWATLNWLLDAAALWVFVAAYGFRLGLDGLIVSFGLANVVAALPVTPGGLGLVEGVLVPDDRRFGAPRSVALLGVVSYRLVNFWMPIPAAGLAYLSLRAESLRLPDSWRQLIKAAAGRGRRGGRGRPAEARRPSRATTCRRAATVRSDDDAPQHP
jgi:hypothetical protein